MTQTTNPLADQFAKLVTDAMGVADGARQEAETFMRAQGERVLQNMDIVAREEFEAVKSMAEKARNENEKLAERIEQLEAKLAALDIRNV